jgi:hypothetical protein
VVDWKRIVIKTALKNSQTVVENKLMKTILLFLILTASFNTFSQKIAPNSSFIISFIDGNFELSSVTHNLEPISLSEVSSQLSEEPKKNEIHGKLLKVRTENSNTFVLLLKSNLEFRTEHKTKTKLKNGTVKISNDVIPAKGSTFRVFPYPIKYIKFLSFEKGWTILLNNKSSTESLCNDKDKSVNYAQETIEKHLTQTLSLIKNQDSIKLKQVIYIDKEFDRADASLGHFWSVSSTIQPYDINETDFGNPITYKHYECPYHIVNSNYFFTKKDSTVKVLSYNWKPVRKSQLTENSEYTEQEIDSVIIQRQILITKLISNQLGAPLKTEQILDSGRIDTHWQTDTGIHIYMFRFTKYAELRLYIYKK